jgi:cystathionine beta-lyase
MEMKKVNPDIGPDIIPFSVADMEFLNAPEIIDDLKNFLDHTVLGYSGTTEEFRAAVCSWMKRKRNWNADPSWIVNTSGIVTAFFNAVKAYTEPGDGVLLLTPVYYPMYKAISLNKRKLVESPLIYNGRQYDIDFEDFAKKAADPSTKLFIMSSPHNPCSRIWRKEELEKLGKICLENNVIVISDEIHFDLIMPGYEHTVFASISDEFARNSVICTAPSKTFNLAGMQISNIFIPDADLRERYIRELSTSTLSVQCNILGYRACQTAYERAENWLDEAIAVIARNRDIVADFIGKEMPQIKLIDLEATYLLWMDFNAFELDYKELERLNKVEGSLFFDEGYIFGEAGRGFERWNLACPTKYVIEGLERLKKTYKKYL